MRERKLKSNIERGERLVAREKYMRKADIHYFAARDKFDTQKRAEKSMRQPT